MDNQALGKAVIYRRKGEQGRSNTVSKLLQAAITKHHKLGAYQQQKFIPLSSGGRKSESRMPAWSGSGESSPQGCRLLKSGADLTWQEKDIRVILASQSQGPFSSVFLEKFV